MCYFAFAQTHYGHEHTVSCAVFAFAQTLYGHEHTVSSVAFLPSGEPPNPPTHRVLGGVPAAG